ncbi:hypothetical protein [Kitasatospora sp. NPDC004289]
MAAATGSIPVYLRVGSGAEHEIGTIELEADANANANGMITLTTLDIADALEQAAANLRASYEG